MTDIDIKKLQQRAAQGSTQHLRRYVGPIGTLLGALTKANVKMERHFTNQVRIADKYIGRYEHPNKYNGNRSRLAIYDRDPRFMYPPVPIVEIHNEADAELFARTIKLAERVLP